jgi:carbamoyl-phosphate synthase small subunit
VKDLQKGTVMITSQNHGFAVDDSSVPSNIDITHLSLFDGTIQGIALKNHPAFSFQGHPEASPGPHDLLELFSQFRNLIKDAKKNRS